MMRIFRMRNRDCICRLDTDDVSELIINNQRKIKTMRLKCSNPLLRHRKECVIFWNEMYAFHDKIEKMEYGINALQFDTFIDKQEETFFQIKPKEDFNNVVLVESIIGLMYDV